jgi:ABC-2 type transport system ATP-binding protein
MSEPLLELRGVSKFWRHFRMENVDLVLPRGLMMGLVGANGAGKTTLIKGLLGLLPLNAGEIRFQERNLRAEGPALRRAIAYVSDEPRFVPETRLRVIKEAHALFFKGDWDEACWKALMADFGLDPELKARGLSLGMKTKFALTLALARNASLLVLDEPTTGLDPSFRRDLLKRLSLWLNEDRAVLFSTHITSDLEDRADLVALMQDGRLRFCLDQDTLHQTWAVVKGAPELLDDDARTSFEGFRTTAMGFEALTDDALAARERFGDQALVERASLEDILVLMGRGLTHAA